jgi:hypothetical protein
MVKDNHFKCDSFIADSFIAKMTISEPILLNEIKQCTIIYLKSIILLVFLKRFTQVYGILRNYSVDETVRMIVFKDEKLNV